jgi:hypothetical protein
MPKVDLAAEAGALPALQESRRSATLQRERIAGAAYLSAALQQPDVQRLPSGLVMQSLAVGAGERPSALDHVSALNWLVMPINGDRGCTASAIAWALSPPDRRQGAGLGARHFRLRVGAFRGTSLRRVRRSLNGGR